MKDTKFEHVRHSLRQAARDIYRILDSSLVANKKNQSDSMHDVNFVISGSCIYNLYHDKQRVFEGTDFDLFFRTNDAYKFFANNLIGNVPVVMLDDYNALSMKTGIFYRSARAYSFSSPPLYPKINLISWHVEAGKTYSQPLGFINNFDYSHAMAVYDIREDVLMMSEQTKSDIEGSVLRLNPKRVHEIEDMMHADFFSDAMLLIKSQLIRHKKFLGRGLVPTEGTVENIAKLEKILEDNKKI